MPISANAAVIRVASTWAACASMKLRSGTSRSGALMVMRSGYLIIRNEIIPWQTIAGSPDAYLAASWPGADRRRARVRSMLLASNQGVFARPDLSPDSAGDQAGQDRPDPQHKGAGYRRAAGGVMGCGLPEPVPRESLTRP